MAVSAVLRSAEAARKKRQTLQNSYADFDWDLSAKTVEDFEAYTNYYNGLLETTGDPSKQLTYTKKLYTAQREFRSKEIQRLNISISEGTGTLYDKQTRMIELYGMAVANDDLNLAQTLRSQISSLDIQIQNMETSAQRTAGAMAANNMKSYAQFDKAMKGMGPNGDGFIMMPDGNEYKTIGLLNAELEQTGGTAFGYFTELAATLTAAQDFYVDAYYASTTQEAADSIYDKYGKYITGEGNIDTMGGKMSVKDVFLASQAEAMNNDLFRLAVVPDPSTGKTAFKFVRNTDDEFVWARRADGTITAITTYAPRISSNQSLTTKVTNEGQFLTKKDDKYYLPDGTEVDGDSVPTIGERLANAGYSVSTGSNGRLNVLTPEGLSVEALLTPEGNLRFMGLPGQFSGADDQGNALAGLYEINVVTGQQREVSPREISMFGDGISAPSETGRSLINQLAGITKPSMMRIPENTRLNVLTNEDVLFGTLSAEKALQGSSVTGGVLSGAATRRNALESEERIRKAREATDMLTQQTRSGQLLTGNASQGINQMPVPQFSADNGAPIRQLNVMNTQAPRISVQPLPAAPRLNVTTGSATSGSKVSVTKSPNSPQRLEVR